MHTLFFSPRTVSAQSGTWGSDVISEVNSRLDLNLEYEAYPYPGDASHSSREGTPSGRAGSGSAICNSLPALASSYVRQERSYRPGAREQHVSAQKAVDSDASDTPHIRRGNFRPGTYPYTHRNYSSYSLRMPDFVKRIFAPPNCLTPKEFEYDNAPTYGIDSQQYSFVLSKRQRDVLDAAVFSQTSMQNQIVRQVDTRWPVDRTCEDRERIPWQSLDLKEDVARIPARTAEQWSSLADWRAQTNEHVVRQTASSHDRTQSVDIEDEMSASTVSCSELRDSQSVYSPVPSLEEPFMETQHRSLDIIDKRMSRRGQSMENDIKAFLASTPLTKPLTALEITQICEMSGGSELLEGLQIAEILDSSIESDRSASANKLRRLSVVNFFPRQTIGKLKKGQRRRAMTVDTIESVATGSCTDKSHSATE